MSTTYSTSLRLALMGTGDQSGTWGNTTNTNLGTLLEQSISGVRPISLTGLTTYTLQAYNGTVDDARSMVLVFTGSPSALVTITAPLVNKFYIIVNLCGQTIRMAASGGSTTLDIPYSSSGLTAQCYCDAANATGAGAGFYSAQTGSAGNFTVNGTLTATGVTDTGALSAASLSVSGAATFSTSPTAPTPTVGDSSTKVATTAFVSSINSVMSGTIQMWPTASAPTGYLVCNGTAVSRTTYSALFAIVGTTFGVGDGSSTFNLPNYQDRMPIGVNTIAASVGATGGSATTTLTVPNLPSHSHSITDPGHYHAVTFGSPLGYGTTSGPDPGAAWNTGTRTNTATTGITATNNTGSGTAANTISPYLGIYFIIKT